MKTAIQILVALVALAWCEPAVLRAADRPILPSSFAGWSQADAKASADPAAADPANTAAVKAMTRLIW